MRGANMGFDILRTGLLCLTVACFHISLWAAEVQVAVAANFYAPMKRLALSFERDTGHKLVMAVGSTGQLDAQIRNGAPFAVLLSADADTPRKLEQEGWTVPGSRFTYATGRLVLWSRLPAQIVAAGDTPPPIPAGRLALAQPKLAPYGAAAQEVLERLAWWPGVRPRLVYAANVAQAHQFVATGNASAGFIALSQVMEQGQIKEGSAWLVPAAMHRPLRQEAVLLKAGEGHAAALALLKYLQSEPARELMRAHGYDV